MIKAVFPKVDVVRICLRPFLWTLTLLCLKRLHRVWNVLVQTKLTKNKLRQVPLNRIKAYEWDLGSPDQGCLPTNLWQVVQNMSGIREPCDLHKRLAFVRKW